jgi:hypothetical protein
MTLWKGSVTQRGGVTTSTGGEAAPGRGKEGDDASWIDVNLTKKKINKTHAVDLAAEVWEQERGGRALTNFIPSMH